MSGYTKLFGSILESTIWLESPPVKVVWITLLAMADRDGQIEASVPGLAKRAGVERGYCEQALAVFLAPDPDSRTTEHDGRRIVVFPGGWRLLNYDTYRYRASKDDVREKATIRQRRLRASRRQSQAVTLVTRGNDIAEAPAPAEEEEKADPDRRERDPDLPARVERTMPERAGDFCQWYADTHERLFHVGYMGTQKDYQKTLELCDKFTDAELRDGALVWFGSDDDFATKGTRSIPKFASRITGCLQQAHAKGL